MNKPSSASMTYNDSVRLAPRSRIGYLSLMRSFVSGMDYQHGAHARRQDLSNGGPEESILRRNTVPPADSYGWTSDCAMEVEVDEGSANVGNRSRSGSEEDAEFLKELWQWASSAMSEPNEGVVPDCLSTAAALCVPSPPLPRLGAPPYSFPHPRHTVTSPTPAHTQPPPMHTLTHATHIQRPRFVVRQTDANPLGGFLEVASPVPQPPLQLEDIMDDMENGNSTRRSCSPPATAMQFAAAGELAYGTNPIEGRTDMSTQVALSLSASTMSPAPQASTPPALRRSVSAPQTPSHTSTRKVNAPGRTVSGLDRPVKDRSMLPASPVGVTSICEGGVQGARATDYRISPPIVSVLGGPVDGERSIEQLYASLDYAERREYRRQSMERWLEKRRHRSSERRVLYTRRSLLASQRVRVGGKFVRQSVGFVSVTELHKSKSRNLVNGSSDDIMYPMTSYDGVSRLRMRGMGAALTALSDGSHVS